MNGPHKIIRDQDGHFRHPSGYPLVVIFDSKDAEDKTPSEISWQEPVVGLHTHAPKKDSTHTQSENAEVDSQPLKFVNISRPAVFDRETKRVIRSHVTQDRRRRKRHLQSTAGKPLDIGATAAHSAPLCKNALRSNLETSALQARPIPRQPFVSLDPFATFPIKMEPHMYALLHRYISIISSPSKPAVLDGRQRLTTQSWLPLAMTDAALFHLILCGSALSKDLPTGKKESLEKVRHMKEAVHLLSTRLRDSGASISDGTIVAVAHLAEFESMVGNFVNWGLHMDGLYKMVQIRGGFAALDDGVKNKVWRADYGGYIGSLSKPRFPAIDILSLPSPPLSPQQPISTLCDGLRNVIEVFAFDGNLIDILGELQYLTSVLNKAPNQPVVTDRIIGSIQYRLLLFQSVGYGNSQHAILQEVCCIGALVYLKTIYDFYRSLHSGGSLGATLTDRAMIQRLRSCLDTADMRTTQARSLFLWILFLGGAAVVGTKDREWFVGQLVQAAVGLNIYSWEDAKSTLIKFLWVGRIHEDTYRRLWDEAMHSMAMLPRADQ